MYMDLYRLHAFLAQAAAPGATQPNPQAEMIKTVLMLGCFGLMFYFVLIRPQQKKAKEQQAMLKSVKPGDKVLTTSGILGVIITVKEKTVTLRSADTKLELAKSALAEITERGTSGSES